MNSIVIYGNNIGSMILAIELSKKQQKVKIINPTSNWGGHFSSIKLGEIYFDIGMNYIELSSFMYEGNNIEDYNITEKNDSARFLSFIRNYLKSLITIKEVDQIKSFYKNILTDDFIIRNSFSTIRILPLEVKELITNELQENLASNNDFLHASKKYLNQELFTANSYYDVSKYNHGNYIHDQIIEPLCKKVFNLQSKQIPSIHHRIAWAPLYYPESIISSLKNDNFKIGETKFYYPEGSFQVLISKLLNELTQSENIEILNNNPIQIINKNDSTTIRFNDDTIITNNLIWFGDLLTYRNLLLKDISKKEFKRSSFTLIFFLVDNIDILVNFGCIYDLDDDFIYRITNQDTLTQSDKKSKSRIIFEANTEVLRKLNISDDWLINYSWSKLKSMGVIKNNAIVNFCASKIFNNAVVQPSFENLELFNSLLNDVKDDKSNHVLLGPSSGFSNSSLNDQIIQALHTSNKF
jgi:protoporphyrinogen oxidase